ncbi:hypothetical protein PG991_008479 [Apiospora marii]|uniref:Uncharacterized protein n=1 Tax=Apiospora marii TaxID=335849 RepID=A0ABR1RLW0_9PEZI
MEFLPTVIVNGKPIDRAQISARFPQLVTISETDFLTWVAGLPKSDPTGILARAGRLTHEYVTWAIDAVLWDYIYDASESTKAELKTRYRKLFPEPDQSTGTSEPWTHLSLQYMAEEAIRRVSQLSDVETERQSAPSGQPVISALVSVPRAAAQEAQPGTASPQAAQVQAQARRQFILTSYLLSEVSKGRSEEEAKEYFPTAVASCEGQVVAVIKGLPQSNGIQRVALNGRLSQAYVTWLADLLLARKIFQPDDTSVKKFRAAYGGRFPQPDPLVGPFSDSLTWALTDTKEPDDADALLNTNVELEGESAPPSQPADSVSASVQPAVVQETPSVATPAQPAQALLPRFL